MRVAISSVADAGNSEKERIILRIETQTDIGDYALLQTEFSGGSVTAITYHAYWFPNKTIEAGDIVVLYTKSGSDGEKVLRRGNRAHFFYWNLPGTIWKHKERAAVLLHAPEWVSKGPTELG